MVLPSHRAVSRGTGCCLWLHHDLGTLFTRADCHTYCCHAQGWSSPCSFTDFPSLTPDSREDRRALSSKGHL